MGSTRHCDICGMVVKEAKTKDQSYFDTEKELYSRPSGMFSRQRKMEEEIDRLKNRKPNKKFSVNVDDLCEQCNSDFQAVAKSWERKRKSDVKDLNSQIKIK